MRLAVQCCSPSEPGSNEGDRLIGERLCKRGSRGARTAGSIVARASWHSEMLGGEPLFCTLVGRLASPTGLGAPSTLGP
jgi:hypothetical protein